MELNWNDFKLKLALLPAVIFWIVSSICFIFGLQFSPMMIGSVNVGMIIAIGLSLSNTIIQLIGNDQSLDDIGYMMFVGWILSYILGIGSNVNTLLNIFQMNSPVLEWCVAIGLGGMIEILPEKLVIQFLRTWKPRARKAPSVNTNTSRGDTNALSNALGAIRKNNPAKPIGQTFSGRTNIGNNQQTPRSNGQDKKNVRFIS